MDEWFRGQVGQPMLTLSFITISFLIQLGLSFITISLSFFKIKYRASVSGRNASVRAVKCSAIARSLEGEHHPESVLATSMNGRLGDILSVTPQM